MASDTSGRPPTGTQYGVGPVTPTPAGRDQISRPLGGAGGPRTGGGSIGITDTITSTPTPGQWDVDSRPGADLEPGTHIKHYELIREIGRGGMGVVYAARDLKLGRRVAMKFLRQVDAEVLDRFKAEAQATAACNHENIVIIYDVDQHHGMTYMVLEFLEGKSLRELMGPFGDGHPLPPSRVVELILPVARALERAHQEGIVHRDLKPENVIVTHSGQVKVVDFGIAKALGSSEHRRRRGAPNAGPGSLTMTREGALVGTLPYMSPEQMGVDEVDFRSDLFALGMIMWEMVTGRHPVEPLTSEALIANLVDSAPMPSVRGAAPDLPDGLVQAIDFCLRKRKAERLGNAGELVRRLENLLPGRHGRQLAEGESPYPGLTAFQEADADRFFGRSRDVARMVARVRELPLTGIVGPSGVGKSSFIRAGVGPALKASGETWDVVTLRPGRHPIAALASVLERMNPRLASTLGGGDHEQLMHRLRAEPGLLGATLRARATAANSHTLLFVDQFEELYTLVPDLDERRAFTAALAAVADDTGAPLRVVVSMRSDFLDRVGEDAQFLEELSRGLVFLSTPDREGLREALEMPVELVGYRFESATIVGDMLDALAGTHGALPLLQFAAAKLWDARDRHHRLLTVGSYRAIGGISGALATHADDIVQNMNASAQRLTQKVFRQLVTPERTRAIVELADLYQLGGKEEITRVIDLLVAARLLVVNTRADAGGGSVEIVHESLIDRWPTLRRWLDEDQEDAAYVAQISAAAKQWDTRGQPVGLLWRGEAMEEARRWYALRPRSLSFREQAFLDAVFALARRGKRVRRIALIAAFVVLGVIATGASVAVVQINATKQEAVQSAERAEAEKKKALQALTDKQAAEQRELEAAKEKEKADEEKLKAMATAAQTSQSLAMSREELEKKNAELQLSVNDARAAREKAEASQRKAQEAAAEAQRAKAELQVKLDAEKARVKQLQEETRKLSTKLKD